MTELDVYRPAAEVAVPAMHDTDSWVAVVQDVIKVANVIYDTPFVPDGLRGSAPAVAAAILSGREMGLGPMTSLANIDVIKGRPTQKPLLMRAMILSRGHKWEDVDNTDTRAVVRGRRKDESQWTTVTFTADQARKAGIDLGKYPADKLYARATSRLAKHKFADVIMGMAYSSDEVEDGLDGEIAVTVEESTDVGATGAGSNGSAASVGSKPRTAQRRKPADRPTGAAPATASAEDSAAAAPAPAQTAPSGTPGELPPLPGEEEDPTTSGASSSAAPDGPQQQTSKSSQRSGDGSASIHDDTDYDTPGTVTTPQITAIWTVLSQVFRFGPDEKEQARAVCSHITGRELASTKDMSRNEAKAVLDTLSHWREQARGKGEHPRDYLIAVMAAQEEAASPGST